MRRSYISKGSESMYFNYRGNRQVYGPGCSVFGCILGLFLIFSIIQGGLYLFFRYFWVIVLLSLAIWFFRTWTNNKNNTKGKEKDNRDKQDWHRDFENRKDTSYHNLDRDFEEVDDEDEFDDF